MERNWNVRAAPASATKEHLPPLSGRRERPSSTGSYRSSGNRSDRGLGSPGFDEVENDPNRSQAEPVKRSNTKSSSSQMDAQRTASAGRQTPTQYEYVYGRGGQVIRTGSDGASKRDTRPVSAASSGKSRKMGSTPKDDPYYMFWLKQAHQGPIGPSSARKQSLGRPESAKSARESDLDDVWVSTRPAPMPGYEPTQDKHLSSFFSRRAPERMALENVKKETLSAARKKITSIRNTQIDRWTNAEQSRIQMRMREMQQMALQQELKTRTTTPLIVCILDSHTSKGGLLSTGAGTQVTFSLQVKYAFGNKLEEGGTELTNWCERMGGFRALISGTSELEANLTYCGRGIYKFDFTPTISGHYQVSVQLGGRDIPGSPFPCFVEEGMTDVDKVAASGMGLLCTEAGIPASFTLYARDTFGNVRSTGGDAFMVTVVGPVSFDAVVVDRHDGTYECTYKTIMCGDYFIHIQLDGKHIRGSPFMASVVPAHTYAPSCRAWGQGLHTAVVGHEAEFQIEAKDLIGNRKIIGGECFTCNATGPTPVDVQILDCDDGTYVGRYVVTVAGEYLLDVMYDGLSLNGSPFSVKVEPGPTIAVKCSAHGKGLKQIESTIPARFVIEARDEFGNQNVGGGVQFGVRIRGVREEIECKIQDQLDGTYLCEYLCNLSGVYFVSIMLDGIDISGSPFKVSCSPGQMVFEQCRVVGPGVCGGFAQVDNTFEIHTHDQFGNPVGVGGELFDVVLWGPERTVASILDRQDSTYLVTYRVNTPGEYQLRVMMNEVDLPGSPFACYIDPLPNEMYAQLYGQVQARTAEGPEGELEAETAMAESVMATPTQRQAEVCLDDDAPLFWKLELTIRQARNLAVEGSTVGNEQMSGTLFVMGEPMVVCSHSGASVQTKPAMTGYNPEWNEELQMVIADLSENLELQVREYDAVHGGADEGRSLGYASVSLQEAVPGEYFAKWVNLEGAPSGTVLIEIMISRVS